MGRIFERVRSALPLSMDEVTPILGRSTKDTNDKRNAERTLEQFRDNENLAKNGHPQSPPPLTVSRTVYILTFCAALSSCNLGFDIGTRVSYAFAICFVNHVHACESYLFYLITLHLPSYHPGVNTDAGILVQQSMKLSDVQLELFMGSINLYAIIGALISSKAVNSFGLRVSFIASAIFFLVGIVMQVCSSTFELLMFGRIFVGVGVGFSMTIDNSKRDISNDDPRKSGQYQYPQQSSHGHCGVIVATIACRCAYMGGLLCVPRLSVFGILLFFYTYLPETKGKALEDMAMYFAEVTSRRSRLRRDETGDYTSSFRHSESGIEILT
eukprot:CAMPEP_0178717316 /NCGR_PEP_ID=MMETSP0699-20121125/21838_1 /TAXON_ID=265572 /ORGANISM="Extubocellulus spinifer, Strain CCMP396" /LENGTH=326 /DNA_ID=CAMNT_0020367101 /DNA_START=72 /DNA_END=1053 /DNA_ORIENTATION=-